MIAWTLYRLFLVSIMVIDTNQLLNHENNTSVEFCLSLLLMLLFERLYISIRITHG